MAGEDVAEFLPLIICYTTNCSSVIVISSSPDGDTDKTACFAYKFRMTVHLIRLAMSEELYS